MSLLCGPMGSKQLLVSPQPAGPPPDAAAMSAPQPSVHGCPSPSPCPISCVSVPSDESSCQLNEPVPFMTVSASRMPMSPWQRALSVMVTPSAESMPEPTCEFHCDDDVIQ